MTNLPLSAILQGVIPPSAMALGEREDKYGDLKGGDYRNRPF